MMKRPLAFFAALVIAFCAFSLCKMKPAHAAGSGNSAVSQVGIGVQTSNAVTSTAATVLTANSARGFLYIQNTGANPVILKFGSTFSGAEGITIPANGIFAPNPVPTNSVWAKSTAGSTLQVIEGNI